MAQDQALQLLEDYRSGRLTVPAGNEDPALRALYAYRTGVIAPMGAGQMGPPAISELEESAARLTGVSQSKYPELAEKALQRFGDASRWKDLPEVWEGTEYTGRPEPELDWKPANVQERLAASYAEIQARQSDEWEQAASRTGETEKLRLGTLNSQRAKLGLPPVRQLNGEKTSADVWAQANRVGGGQFLKPFQSSANSATRLWAVKKAIDRVQAGKETESDWNRIADFQDSIADEMRGTTFMGGATGMATRLPSYMVEFMMGARAGGLVFKGLEREGSKAAATAIARMAEQETRSAVARAVGKVGGELAKSAVQTAMMPSMVAEAAIRQQVPDFLAAPGDDNRLKLLMEDEAPTDGLTAVLKGVADTGIEVFSERSGGIINSFAGKVAGSAPVRISLEKLKAATFARWLAKHPGKPIAELSKTFAQVGWHGQFTEIAEEYVAELAKAGVGLKPLELPTATEVGQMGVAFALPGAAGAAQATAGQLPGIAAGIGRLAQMPAGQLPELGPEDQREIVQRTQRIVAAQQGAEELPSTTPPGTRRQARSPVRGPVSTMGEIAPTRYAPDAAGAKELWKRDPWALAAVVEESRTKHNRVPADIFNALTGSDGTNADRESFFKILVGEFAQHKAEYARLGQPYDSENEGRIQGREPHGQEPGRPIQEPQAGRETAQAGGVFQGAQEVAKLPQVQPQTPAMSAEFRYRDLLDRYGLKEPRKWTKKNGEPTAAAVDFQYKMSQIPELVRAHEEMTVAQKAEEKPSGPMRIYEVAIPTQYFSKKVLDSLGGGQLAAMEVIEVEAHSRAEAAQLGWNQNEERWRALMSEPRANESSYSLYVNDPTTGMRGLYNALPLIEVFRSTPIAPSIRKTEPEEVYTAPETEEMEYWQLKQKFDTESSRLGIKPPKNMFNKRGGYTENAKKYWKKVENSPILSELKRRMQNAKTADTKAQKPGLKEEEREWIKGDRWIPEEVAMVPTDEMPRMLRYAIRSDALRFADQTKSAASKKALMKIAAGGEQETGADADKQREMIIRRGLAWFRDQDNPGGHEHPFWTMLRPSGVLDNTWRDQVQNAVQEYEAYGLAARDETRDFMEVARSYVKESEGVDPSAEDLHEIMEDLIGRKIEPLRRMSDEEAKAAGASGIQASLLGAGVETTEGWIDTGNGWIDPEGRFHPDIDRREEAKLRKEMEEEGQALLPGVEEAEDEGFNLFAVAPGLRNILRGAGGTPAVELEEELHHPNSVTEKALRTSHSIPTPSWWKKVKNAAGHFWRCGTRTYEFLPKGGQFDAAIDQFRMAETIHSGATHDTASILSRIMAPLRDLRDYMILERYIQTENQLASLDRGEPLRWRSTSREEWSQYKATLDAELHKNPRVRAALQVRKAMVTELARKLVDADLLPREALKNAETYYHQMVISYQDVESLGRRISSRIKQGVKPFQRKRVKGYDLSGEKYDPNSDYIEAEAKWMIDAFCKLRSEAIWNELKRIYDVMPECRRNAKSKNFEIAVGGADVVARIEELRRLIAESASSEDAGESDHRKLRAAWLAELHDLDPTWQQRQNLAIAFKMLGMGYNEDAEAEEMKEIDWEYIERLAKTDITNDMPDYQKKPIIAARMAQKAIGERNSIVRQLVEARGEHLRDWEDMVPEGYAAAQIGNGHIFYPVWTLPERIVSQAAKSLQDEVTVPMDKIKKATAMGPARDMVVMPVELASELDKLKGRKPPHAIDAVVQDLVRDWKKWLLGKPIRILPYNMRNMTGDLDPAIAAAPGILRWQYVGKSIPLCWKHFMRKAMGEPPIMRLAREYGVIDSSLAMSEVADAKDLPKVRAVLEAWTNKRTIPAEAWHWYWDNATRFTAFRESVLRLSAFMYYRDAMKQGRLTNYGASNPAAVENVRREFGNDRAAAKLARELIGDYGDITVMGNYLRRRLIPFWAFQEINLRRYYWLYRNAISARSPARLAQTMGAMGASATTQAIRLMLLTRMHWLFAAQWLYNNLVWPDEEDDLDTFDKQNPHLILGRRQDGSVRLFRQIGAMGEFYEWFGLNTGLGLARLLKDHQVGADDLAKEMAKDPANKLIQGLGPIKSAVELLIGQTTFPDVFNMRTIPRGEIAASAVDMLDAYKELRGRLLGTGERAREGWRERYLWAITDPRQTSIHAMHELRERFNDSKGLESEPGRWGRSKYKEIRETAFSEDFEAFRDARKSLMTRGVTYEQFLTSLRYIDPIDQELNEKREREFVDKFLSARQRARYNVARSYAQEVSDTLWHWWHQASRLDDTPEEQEQLRKEMAAEQGRAARTIRGPAPGRRQGETADDYQLRLSEWRKRREKAKHGYERIRGQAQGE